MHAAASHSVFALFDVGGGEMILIFVVILLLFGGKRMPELARGLGKSLNEFKKATSGVEAQIKQAMEDARETANTAINAPERRPAPRAPAPAIAAAPAEPASAPTAITPDSSVNGLPPPPPASPSPANDHATDSPLSPPDAKA